MLRVRCVAALALLLLGLLPGSAPAQMLNARRLGMGGVVTSDNGDHSSSNIAFRAVPKGTMGSSAIPIPLGLIQYAADHPTFDSSDSTFNIFDALNVLTNPPLTIQIVKPKDVSGDISVYIAQDSLQIDLADVKRVIPDGSMAQGGVYHLGGFGAGIRNLFVQVGPIVHVKNEFTLSDRLRDALKDAVPFTGDTRYGVSDDARAQAAIAFQAGLALRAFHLPGENEKENPDPRRNGATAIYLGAAPKYLLGLAYGDAQSEAGITTGDTLFASSNPVTFDMVAQTRHATIGGDGGVGHGFGSDVGAVLYHQNVEVGVGLNDFLSQISWKTTVRRHVYDNATNEFTTTEVATDEHYVSRIPVTATINVAKRMGETTIAADAVAGELRTTLHAGAEFWLGMWALRAGTYRDANKIWQGTAGAGIRLGKLGIDMAIATHSRNIERERGAELSASLSIY